MEVEDSNPARGIYQGLADDILHDYVVEGNSIITGGKRIDFSKSELGYDISLEGNPLGNTADNYFLAYLSELFEDRDEESLERIRNLLEDKRTIQATELQGTITPEDRAYDIGGRRVEFSSRYFKCSCPDWKFRRRLGGCKHIAALRILDV
jgi:hypothetical protein